MVNIDNKKLPKYLIAIGLICVVGVVPIFSNFVTSYPLLIASTIKENEDSNSYLPEAYALEFSIASSEKVTVKFSGNFANVSTTIRFAAKADYDEQYALNATPTSVTELWFVYCQPEYGNTGLSGQCNDATTQTISGDGTYLIEFSGATDGSDNLIVVPGNYVLIVSGTNSSNIDTNEEIKFNLEVLKEFPGLKIAYYAGWAGWALLSIGVAMLVLQFIKKPFEGRKDLP